MFAFALVDCFPPPNGPKAMLARDRMGIKPLLYIHQGGKLVFGSELRAIRAGWTEPLAISESAITEFLAVGSIFQPATIYRDVVSMPPGTWIEWNEGRLVTHTYWDLHEATTKARQELRNISAEEAAAGVRERLTEATRYHLVSDAPIGAFLSGGVDSTAIVALMSREGSGPIRTFSVGFAAAGPIQDERGDARRFAAEVGAIHTEVEVSEEMAARAFPTYVSALDQPSIDGINTMFVSEAAAKSVRVALSGLGGDEAFAGYRHFEWLAWPVRPGGRREARFRKFLEWSLRIWPTGAALRSVFRLSTRAERLAMLRRITGNSVFERNVESRFSRGFWQHLIGVQETFIRPDADPVQQTSYGEMRGYLLSTLLRDSDVMSMSQGLEVRPVLLHHPLVEYAYALPEGMKWGDTGGKKVLREALRGVVPEEVLSRRKRGFEMPFAEWMAGKMSDRILSLLQCRNARELFSPGYLMRLRLELRSGKPPRELWAWSVLLEWLSQHGITL
jgi:asparagine synthase (glutamine-hydrolysing)